MGSRLALFILVGLRNARSYKINVSNSFLDNGILCHEKQVSIELTLNWGESSLSGMEGFKLTTKKGAPAMKDRLGPGCCGGGDLEL